jgi:hypothetical protein
LQCGAAHANGGRSLARGECTSRGLEGQILTARVSGRAGGSEDGLRKGKPEFNGDTGFRDAGVNSRGIDGGWEGEISNTSGAGGSIDSDWSCNRTALMVAEAKIDKVSEGDESGMNGGANDGGFLVSIVGTAGNVIACSNQFSGRTVLDGMFEEEVRHEIEAASFKVRSIVNGWSSWNQQFNGVCGTTKGQRNKSVTAAGSNG